MSTPDDVATAQDEIVRTRARMAETVAQLEARVTGQMEAVKAKLDVVQMIRDNPWTALAIATGLGVAISASGADVKAAEAAREAATQAADRATEAAKAAPGQARDAMGAARQGIRDHLDGVAAAAVGKLIESLGGK